MAVRRSGASCLWSAFRCELAAGDEFVVGDGYVGPVVVALRDCQGHRDGGWRHGEPWLNWRLWHILATC